MYSCGHMAEQKQDDQLEHTYSSSVRIRDVALKTYRRRWTIGRSGERGSGISVLAARHDDDDDDVFTSYETGNEDFFFLYCFFFQRFLFPFVCQKISGYFRSCILELLGNFRPGRLGELIYFRLSLKHLPLPQNCSDRTEKNVVYVLLSSEIYRHFCWKDETFQDKS